MSSLTTEQMSDLTDRVHERLREFDMPLMLLPSLGVVRMAVDLYEEMCSEIEVELFAALDTKAAQNVWRLAHDHETGRLREVTPWEGAILAPDEDEADPAPDPPVDAEPPIKCDEKSTAAEPPQKSVEKYSEETAPAEPIAPAVPRQRTHEVGPEPSAPALTPAAVATLGPEHTMVTPLRARAAALADTVTPPTERINGHAVSRPRTLAEVDAEKSGRTEQLRQIIAELQRMAVDGAMPTIADWDERKPSHLPIWKSISQRHGLLWSELAKRAGLTTGRGRKGADEVADLQRKAAAHDAGRTVTYDAFVAEIKRMAMGKSMPSQSAFNDAKPALWPTATALVIRFHTSWEALAEVCGLELRPRGRKRATA